MGFNGDSMGFNGIYGPKHSYYCTIGDLIVIQWDFLDS